MIKTACSVALWLMATIGSTEVKGFDFGPYRTSLTGSSAEAVAVGDVNGDRLDDVVLGTTFYFDDANDYRIMVYLQRQDGSLAPPVKYHYGTHYSGIAIALGDLNHDGTKDIVACHPGGLFVMRSNGHGGFTTQAVPLAKACTNLVVLDIDLDTHLDVVAQSWAEGATLLYGDGKAGFTHSIPMATAGAGYNDLKAGDLTGDGHPDLVLTSMQSPNFFVYPHNGKDRFAAAVVYPSPDRDWLPSAATIGDFDSDGRNELAVATHGNEPNSNLYLYRRDATSGRLLPPTKIATDDLPFALVTRDLDRDGREDILVNHTGALSIGRYIQGAAGLSIEETTTSRTGEGPYSPGSGDFNDDGCSDAAVANINYGLVTLYGFGCQRKRAQSDFDGDGLSDLLWHNRATGASVIWIASNHLSQRAVTRVTNRDWQIVGTGDFQGDGRDDILWYNTTTGASVVWKSADAGDAQALARVTDLAWRIARIGDFDGDGKDDVMWRHVVTGANAIWRSGNSSSQLPIARVPDTRWMVSGTGDFNGDGRSDLLWRHAVTGENALWLSANFHTQKPMPTVPDTSWRMVGTGDYDGDGLSDIVWRHANGTNEMWLAANHRSSTVRMPSVPGHWVPAGSGDYDGNGKSDLLWRNTANGANTIWRAASHAVTRAVATVANADWVVLQ